MRDRLQDEHRRGHLAPIDVAMIGIQRDPCAA